MGRWAAKCHDEPVVRVTSPEQVDTAANNCRPAASIARVGDVLLRRLASDPGHEANVAPARSTRHPRLVIVNGSEWGSDAQCSEEN